MSDTTLQFDLKATLTSLDQAISSGSITASAGENIRNWLTLPKYARYAPEVAKHIEQEEWQVLDDVFWTIIPFGTGGRRGKMYSIGSNAINERTIGESAQGLADYVKKTKPNGPWSCAIAYDTRHRSREFAELCACLLVASGFEIYFIDDYRSTPELSFAIRYKNCDCGIMVTASHNPPSDNAVKVYWSSGAQLVPPHDKGVIDCVNAVETIDEVVPGDFQRAVESGSVHLCKDEVDAALLAEHVKCDFPGPRNLKVIFSPLHGVGEFNVKSLLNAVGFENLEIYERHREPSGDFPNVPGHVSNPENPRVFDEIIEHAKKTGAELILASDPDCDRMGAAAPLTLDPAGPWATLDGNQLGALLAEFVLSKRQQDGTLSPNHYVITTLVTTMLIKRIAEAYGVQGKNENLVGFKWICSLIDELGPEGFVLGTEESHGYLVGTYARDKDGAIACMLMSELAAEAKAEGKSVHDKLNDIYEKYGYHGERLLTIKMEGSDGMRRMKTLMEKLRTETPRQLGGHDVKAIRDYSTGTTTFVDGSSVPLAGPTGDLVILDTTTDGNYVAVRPSGTEPKIKFYLFGFIPVEKMKGLDECRAAVVRQFDAITADLNAFAESV